MLNLEKPVDRHGRSGRSGRDENTNASTTDMIVSENFKILENLSL